MKYASYGTPLRSTGDDDEGPLTATARELFSAERARDRRVEEVGFCGFCK